MLGRDLGGKGLTQTSATEAALGTLKEGWDSAPETVQDAVGHLLRASRTETGLNESEVSFH